MGKKRILLIGSIGLVLLLVIGVSYAYWTKTFFQTESNIVDSGCFKIEFTDQKPIQLDQAFPVLDHEGLQNAPYTFTIQNVCNTSAKYQINLESLEVDGKKLPEKYLKANLKEGNVQKITTKLDKELNSKLNTDPTLEGAVSAYKLYEGILDPNETKEYNLRIWMHEDVSFDMEDSMNASYRGKVSIITSYYQDKRGTLKNTISDGIPELKSYRGNITKIIMEEVMNPKETEITFDLSENQDGSVMGYLVTNEDNTTYTLYLQSEGGIIANSRCNHLFYDFSKLESIEGLEIFDTSKVTNMSFMFYNCSSLTNLDVSNFDTRNVELMHTMFADCQILINLDVSGFDTSNVTNMASMFHHCYKLESLNLSNFDTSKVVSMEGMFSYCTSLTTLDLANFNTSNIKSMGSMFYSCGQLERLNVSSFDTRNVTNMRTMFGYCTSLTSLDISSFNTNNVKDAYGMFYNCTALTNLNLRNFDFSSLTVGDNLFFGLSEQLHLIIKDESVKIYILNNIPGENTRPSGWNDANFEIL